MNGYQADSLASNDLFSRCHPKLFFLVSFSLPLPFSPFGCNELLLAADRRTNHITDAITNETETAFSERRNATPSFRTDFVSEM